MLFQLFLCYFSYVVDDLDWCDCGDCLDGYLMESCSNCSQSKAYWEKASRKVRQHILLNSKSLHQTQQQGVTRESWGEL